MSVILIRRLLFTQSGVELGVERLEQKKPMIPVKTIKDQVMLITKRKIVGPSALACHRCGKTYQKGFTILPKAQ